MNKNRCFKALLAACIGAYTASAAAFFDLERATPQDMIVQQVFETPDVSKEKIVTIAKRWVAENFQSAKSAIDLDNPAEGLLIVKGVIPYPCEGFECVAKSSWGVAFTMSMEAKDSRFRLTFTNVRMDINNTEFWQKSAWTAIRPKLLGLGDEIKAAIQTGKKDDW